MRRHLRPHCSQGRCSIADISTYRLGSHGLALSALSLALAGLAGNARADTQTVTTRTNVLSNYSAQASNGNTLVYSVPGSPSNGGAIYVASGATLSTSTDGSSGAGLVFSGNSAETGGAIDLHGLSALINNTTFSANSSSHGGAIYSTQGSMLTIVNSSFANNTSLYAGAVNVDGNSNISGSSFTNNSATQSGGGFYNSTGSSVLNGNTFTGNTAQTFGGGLLNYGTLSSTSDTFNGNSAALEGGSIFNSNGANAVVTAGTFVNNSSGRYGGAIENKVGSSLTVNNSTFSANHSVDYGGALENWNSNATINASTFTGNYSLYGGAIDNYQDSTATVLTVNDSSFVQNTARFGGVIYNYGGTLNLNVSAGATSTYAGNTMVSASGVTTASSLYFENGGSLNVNVAAGGLLDMRDPLSLQNGSTALSINKNGAGIWALGGTSALANTGAATHFTVSDGTLYLDKASEKADAGNRGADATVTAGALQLGNSASTFTLGSTATLVAAGANSITSSGNVVLANGATLRGGTASDATSATLLPLGGATSLTLTGNGGVRLQGALVLKALAAGDQFTLAANLVNAAASVGRLVIEGLGTVKLTGTSTYTGSTIVNGGNLLIAQGGSAKNTATVWANGGVMVDGVGSSLTAVGTGTAFIVGNGGSGSLTASNGAAVESRGELNLGQSAGDSGTATVTSGATLTVATSINIGKLGSGALTVSDGGHLNLSGYVSIADQAGSHGTVLVTGSNSSITSSIAETIVGNHAGSGVLTVADHATVTTPSVVIANDAGSSGTLNIGAAAGDTAVAAGTLVANAMRFGAGSGTLVFNHTDSAYQFSQALSGTGTVNLLAGTSVFTGNNTYTGSTTISAGTLQIGNGGTTGAIASNIVDNSALVFNRSDALTYAGNISGTGSLTQAGSGTLTLTGSNSYSGLTTISAGTLQIGNGGSSGSLTGAVLNNGHLQLNRSTDFSLAGAIFGSGDVIKRGNNTLTLSGVNSYSGGTKLEAGTLLIGNASAIGSGTLDMAEFTTIAFTDSFTLGNAITLTGDPYVDVAAGVTTTLSGSISDGSLPGDLVKLGAGTLILSGTSTYTGPTEVAAGTLDMQGSIVSQVTVDSGATLIGNGSIGGLTVLNGATVSPGGNTSVDTLAVVGDIRFASGSRMVVDTASSGLSDLLHATGTATLNGGSVLALQAGNNWRAATRYTLLTADSGLSGSFSDVTATFAFLNASLSYDANNVYLTLARNGSNFQSVGLTPNQKHSGAAVESLGLGTPLYDSVVVLEANQAQVAFESLAGASLASARSAVIDDARYLPAAINRRLQDVALNTQDGLWSSAWGHSQQHSGDGNYRSQNVDGQGLVIGADRQFGANRLGAVIGQSHLTSDSSADHISSRAEHLGIYAATALDAWQLQAAASHSWYHNDSRRRIDLAGISDRARASYASGVTQVYVDGGYRFDFAQGSLTPFVNLARSWSQQERIAEHDSAAALRVQAQSTAVNYASLGLRAAYSPTATSNLHASLGQQHAWGDVHSTQQQRFASGGDSFKVAGTPIAENTTISEVGVSLNLAPNLSVDASYRGEWASAARDSGARISLDYRF